LLLQIRPCLVADNVISDQNSSCGSPPLSIVVNGDEQHGSSTPVPTSTSVSRSKPQACRICGRVLASTSSYYVHLKSHSNNKPYRCTQCEACFCRKPYLEVSTSYTIYSVSLILIYSIKQIII
jgi:MinD superfamily P-loop ATPase